VNWNCRELEEHLPRPGREWTWEECGLSFGTLMQLMDRGLTTRESGTYEWETTKWETTETCWTLLIDRVGTNDDGVGTGVGQERLFAPGEIPPEKTSRVLTSSRSSTSDSKQVTLTGDDTVDVDTDSQDNPDVDWVMKCREAGKLGDPAVREKRRREREPGQTSLIEWTEEWDVSVRDGMPVERPAGEVY